MAYTKYIEDVVKLVAADAKMKDLPEDMKAQIDGIVDFERILANVKIANKYISKYML